MSFEKYVEKKKKILAELNDLNKNIQEEKLKNIINSKIKTLENDKFTISVFGHYSVGKSSFLNALLGFSEEVLKEDELPTTATITRLRYPECEGLKNKVQIIYKNNKKINVDLKELELYTTTFTDIDVENEISEVIFYVESELLKNNVEIVDTPGFNSTNELHTEIAKKHISSSDASIYLFDYKQAGTNKDFKFLADINDKMDRIFLVLNKVDLHDDTEGDMSETIESLKNKIKKYGAYVENKKIYPISAMKKKLILKGSENNKYFDDLFNNFSSDLAEYLTGEESVKDRLIAPLKNILFEILKVRECKNDEISILNLEGDESNKKIEILKEELESLNEELADRKKQIRKLVKSNINNFVKGIELKRDELEEEMPTRIAELKSAFSLNEDAFIDIINEIESKIKRKVNQKRTEFIYSILEIVDSNIDNEAGYEMLMKKIESSLTFQISKGEIDFSLSKKDENYIEKLYKELDNEKNKLDNLKNDRMYLKDEVYRLEAINKDIAAINSHIRFLESEKSAKILSIGEGVRRVYEDNITIERKREGLVGAIGNILFGKKKEIKQVTKVDDSDIKRKEEEKKRIKDYCDNEINEENGKLNKLKEEIQNNSSKRYELEDCEERYSKQFENYFKYRERVENKELEYENEIFEKNKRKIKNNILDYIDETVDEIKDTVIKNELIIRSITEESLIDIKNSINIKQDSIDEIIETQICENKDAIKSKLMTEITQLNDIFNKINTIKGELY